MKVSVEVHHYFHGVDSGLSEAQFTELKQILINNQGMLLGVLNKLGQIAQREEQMAADVNQAISNLATKVESMEDEGEALREAFAGLVEQMRENAGNADAINALADRVEAEGLADKVLTNTPSDPSAGGGASGGGAAPAGGDVPADPGGGAPTGRRG